MIRLKIALQALKLMLRCMACAIRHPLTPVLVCANPGKMSPIPWWGSAGIMTLGLIFWLVGGYLQIDGLDEVGRALVYVPLGNLFGMSYAFAFNNSRHHKGGV